MTPQLTEAEYLDEYRIRLTFEDECTGVVDFQNELWGAVFEPLRDTENFRRFRLNHELNTIEWPATGADFAPEFLYQQATRRQSAA